MDVRPIHQLYSYTRGEKGQLTPLLEVKGQVWSRLCLSVNNTQQVIIMILLCFCLAFMSKFSCLKRTKMPDFDQTFQNSFRGCYSPDLGREMDTPSRIFAVPVHAFGFLTPLHHRRHIRHRVYISECLGYTFVGDVHVHCVLKYDTDLACYIFDIHQPILIFVCRHEVVQCANIIS